MGFLHHVLLNPNISLQTIANIRNIQWIKNQSVCNNHQPSHSSRYIHTCVKATVYI